MVLNRLTYLNLKTRGLLIDKKVKADVARPRQLPMQGGGSQLLKWTGIQNKNLTNAWVHVSEDRIKNNNQQLNIFWESVLDTFHEFCQEDGERVERTVSSLKNHLSDMNRACKVYETCLKSVMQGPISGM
ncbi:hypothetical protein GIB67_005775 [Kingdonia uniflora]|uniref:Uncharacterized protein n=1 Tax=Kingdonia uniflora TaxID=39325 RepID=A0A7J7KVJ2_9MAGN|nr:hypothetical protein GIB67_005775 [Kingdonia uniflora]